MNSLPPTGREFPGRPQPKYVALLAGAAVLVLAIGALVKPKKLAEATSLPLSETAPLQALARRGELRDLTDFLAGRVTVVAHHLVYLDDLGAGGVAWAGPDSVVIGGSADSPLIAVPRAGDTSAIPVVQATAERLARRGWVLVAARQADGTIASAVGMSGGQTTVRCGNQVYREQVVATPLGAEFEGGGLFDLEGNLMGIVGRCGARYAAVSVADVESVLAAGASSEARLRRAYGLRTEALDATSRRYFKAETGALVGEVVLGTAAGRAGLRPGDVIAAVDSLPVRSPDELAELLLSGPAMGRTLALIRNGRPAGAKLTDAPIARDTSLGLTLMSEPTGLVLAEVEPDSRAGRAGLRPRDRLLRIGRLQPVTSTQAQQALAGAEGPVYLVYRRESDEPRERSERGVFLGR